MEIENLERRDFIKSGMVLGETALISGLVGCSSNSSQTSDGSTAQLQNTEPATNATDSDTASTTLAGSGIKTDNSTPGGSPAYATADLSAAGLLRVYQALGFTATGNVAVKLHMGEEGNPYFLQPSLLTDLAQILNATFVDTTTLYGERRSTADGYASLDPVALDRASLDQIYLPDDAGKSAVIERVDSRSGAHVLDYAESLGVGSQTYETILV